MVPPSLRISFMYAPEEFKKEKWYPNIYRGNKNMYLVRGMRSVKRKEI